jgi:hypothetical protein
MRSFMGRTDNEDEEVEEDEEFLRISSSFFGFIIWRN